MSFHKHAFAKKLLEKSAIKKLSVFGIIAIASMSGVNILQANSKQQANEHLVSMNDSKISPKDSFIKNLTLEKSEYSQSESRHAEINASTHSAWQFQSPVASVDTPDHAIENSTYYIDMDIEILSHEELSMTLPDGQNIVFQQTSTEEYASGSKSWIGNDPQNEDLFASITKYEDSIAGEIRTADGTYEVATLKNGKSIIYKVDTQKLNNLSKRDDAVRFFNAATYSASQNIQSAAEQNVNVSNTINEFESTAQADTIQSTLLTTPSISGDVNTITEIDVLYVYTKASIAKFGLKNLIASVENAVSVGNSGAYPNSKIKVRLKPVAHLAYNYSDSSTLLTDLQNNKYMNLEYYRNKYGADLVQGITYSYSYCGMGYQMSGDYSQPFGRYAYSIVKQSCIGYSMLHELGHNMGMDHNVENSGTYSPTAAKGHRYCSSTGFRTLMSYDCSSISVPRISRFSNPNAYYKGLATGKVGSANNAGILDGTTRFKVERFRLKKG
ncbi:MAG: M12 family metallo-peptidase [Pseudomonadota bacterium]